MKTITKILLFFLLNTVAFKMTNKRNKTSFCFFILQCFSYGVYILILSIKTALEIGSESEKNISAYEDLIEKFYE